LYSALHLLTVPIYTKLDQTLSSHTCFSMHVNIKHLIEMCAEKHAFGDMV
jgi:hypothetical protein